MREEFEKEFKCMYRPLCLYALQFVGDIDNAEDIVQQAFTDVWEKMRKGLLICNFKAYIYQTVRNRSVTFSSQNHIDNTEENDLPDLADTSDEERIQLAERDARLWTAIDQLPTERRKIFLLSKRDGLKYQEIAEELHISVKTVENQIAKALKTLRGTAARIYAFFFLT